MRVVLCTTPQEKSEEIAEILLKEKLCACINIIPGIKSMYWWEDKIQTDQEDILIIKTKEELIDPLTQKIKEIHPYDIPEVIALKVKGGNKDYIQWVLNSIK